MVTLYLPFILVDHLLQLEAAAEDGLVGGGQEDGLGRLVPLALSHGLDDAPHQVRAQRVGRGPGFSFTFVINRFTSS